VTESKASSSWATPERLELITTVLMAMAAILTAWTGFQSTKWSGEQARNYSSAGANRTESSRFDTRAAVLSNVDVATFLAWLDAVNADVAAGNIELIPGEPYVPTAGTLSGFLYERVRGEFKPALDAWAEAYILDPENAPTTPFQMDEYVLEAARQAQTHLEDAQAFFAEANENNETADRYVLTTVLFALVLFFAGVSTKLEAQRNQLIATIMAMALFFFGVIVVLLLPVHALFG
jgi:hypothetical protein